MKIEIVNYVKRKYFSTSSLSDAFKLYCDVTGNAYIFGWTFDFWCHEILSGKEFHVIDSNDNEIIDQYAVITELNVKGNTDVIGKYYQVNFNGEEK